MVSVSIASRRVPRAVINNKLGAICCTGAAADSAAEDRVTHVVVLVTPDIYFLVVLATWTEEQVEAAGRGVSFAVTPS
jgi:hypothetical protein